MYRSHVQNSTHSTVCTDHMYNTAHTVQYVQIQPSHSPVRSRSRNGTRRCIRLGRGTGILGTCTQKTFIIHNTYTYSTYDGTYSAHSTRTYSHHSTHSPIKHTVHTVRTVHKIHSLYIIHTHGSYTTHSTHYTQYTHVPMY